MNLEIEKLLKEIHSPNVKQREEALTILGDYLDYYEWEKTEEFKIVLDELILRFFVKEKNEDIKILLQMNINKAFLKDRDFSDINLSPLLQVLKVSSDITLLVPGIYMLSSTRDKKHIPFIQKFFTHVDKHVRNEAKEAFNYLNGLVLV